MRNIVLAATAVLVLAAASAPSLAAARGNTGASQDQQNRSSSVDANCASILADTSGHSRNDVARCQGHSA